MAVHVTAALVLAAAAPGAWTDRAAAYGVQHPGWTNTAAPIKKQAHNGTAVEYAFRGVTYEGYVSLPARSIHASPPGMLIAHQWMGLGDYEKSRADEAAAQGYMAFALDV